jgi:hypothetical protein
MKRTPFLPCTLALMALLACAGCAEQNAVDLTGTWELTESSARNFGMPRRPRITLNPDRSFTASEIQKELFYNPETLTGRGTWKRIGDELFLAFPKIKDKDKSFEVRLVITDETKTNLFFYRGGRTSGYRLFFEKT